MAQKTQTIDGVTSTGTPSGLVQENPHGATVGGDELASLAGLAASVDGEHLGALPDGSAIADQPPPVDYAQEAAMTVDTVAALITGYCPATVPLWTDEKKAHVSAALAPVYEKYGWTLGGMPCELVLIITAGPLLYQSSKLIATQMAQEKAKAKPRTIDAATGQAQPEKAQAKPEAPEVLRHPQTALYK